MNILNKAYFKKLFAVIAFVFILCSSASILLTSSLESKIHNVKLVSDSLVLVEESGNKNTYIRVDGEKQEDTKVEVEVLDKENYYTEEEKEKLVDSLSYEVISDSVKKVYFIAPIEDTDNSLTVAELMKKEFPNFKHNKNVAVSAPWLNSLELVAFSSNGKSFQKEELEEEDLLKFPLEERKSIEGAISVTEFFLAKETFDYNYTSSERAGGIALLGFIFPWTVLAIAILGFIGVMTKR